MGLRTCTTAINKGGFYIRVGDVLDSNHEAVVTFPTLFTAQDAEVDAIVANAPSAAYTQTYSTANRTVANATVDALTDSTTGTAATTLAAGVGVETLAFNFDLADIADGELVTDYTIGYKFKLLAVNFAVTEVVTTADKRTDFVLDIGATPTTGGVVSVTSAAAAVGGVVVAGTAITAANTGAANATLSIRAASTTAHAEGKGTLLIRVQNMDTADAVASLAAQHGKARADDLDNRQTITAIIDDLQSMGLLG